MFSNSYIKTITAKILLLKKNCEIGSSWLVEHKNYRYKTKNDGNPVPWCWLADESRFDTDPWMPGLSRALTLLIS